MAESVQDQSGRHAPALVWFRDDLRLADNPALSAAAATGRPVVCVYLDEQGTPGLRPTGGAARWWLHHSLRALSGAVEALGGDLLLLHGEAETTIPALAASLGCSSVYWNRRYGEAERAVDGRIKERLKEGGLAAHSFNSHLLNEPWEVKGKTGAPLKVFTPYWRAARERGEPPSPLAAPPRIRPLSSGALGKAGGVTLDALGLLPTEPDWAAEMATLWTPGEAGARAALDAFLAGPIDGYGENRNRPDFTSTSRLSPHLRFGEISPRQIWHATRHASETGALRASDRDAEKFLSEVGWREFSYHLLYQFPKLGEANFQPRFDAFPWTKDHAALKAWRKGQTGYPIVDAGMRELWRTGWMHNRVRMVTASFLVKHLLQDWRLGEAWFWDTLLDADPANNAASWQWVAGSGADAAPYFRIFAPVLQGEKFDPKGDYVRKYVPEIAKLPDAFLHKPWEAPAHVLAKAGVTLGLTYPHPIVKHERARDRALAAFKSISGDEAA
jgi:deoxyribodipyrimidine photo-lyase